MKWIVMLLATAFIVWFDYGLLSVIVARGGWDAYVATNPFAHTAVAGTITINIIYLLGWWIMWIIRND